MAAQQLRRDRVPVQNKDQKPEFGRRVLRILLEALVIVCVFGLLFIVVNGALSDY